MKKLRNFNCTKSLIWLHVKTSILKFFCSPVKALTVQKNKMRLVKSTGSLITLFHIVYLNHKCTKSPIYSRVYKKSLNHLVV